MPHCSGIKYTYNLSSMRSYTTLRKGELNVDRLYIIEMVGGMTLDDRTKAEAGTF